MWTGLFPRKTMRSLSGLVNDFVSVFSPSKSVSQLFALCHSMDRFVSKRSSSSLNLDSASLDDARAERAAIALSVCATSQVHEDARSAQLATALGTLFRSTSSTTTSFRTAPACSARSCGDHRPAAHTRGARPHQDSPCRHSRANHPSRCTR